MKNSAMGKDQIQFAHTFRHIQNRFWQSFFYLLLFVIPLLTLFILHYRDLSVWMNTFALNYLQRQIPGVQLSEVSIEFIPTFGALASLSLPSPPSSSLVALLMVVISVIILMILVTGRRKGHPVSIFLSFSAILMIISGLFGYFFPDSFPYIANDYAQLYMTQTFATLLFFIILLGTITVFLGVGSVIHRVIFVLVTLIFMLVFSTLRYIVYLWIVSQISLLFMPVLIFAFGPFFDFLFLVYFYGFYIHYLIKRVSRKRSEVVWKW